MTMISGFSGFAKAELVPGCTGSRWPVPGTSRAPGTDGGEATGADGVLSGGVSMRRSGSPGGLGDGVTVGAGVVPCWLTLGDGTGVGLVAGAGVGEGVSVGVPAGAVSDGDVDGA